MKIRINGDSVRLRLDRSEVERIGHSEMIECVTHFPHGAQFRYQLAVGPDDQVTAQFDKGCIQVVLPESSAKAWAGDEQAVSLRGCEALSDGTLVLLIEKDFECLEPRAGEDQSNRFKNPKAG